MNAVAAPPQSAITRSTDHRYTKDGVTVPGVTTVLRMLDKSGPLIAWASRETAEAAIRLLPELPKMLETSGEAGVTKLLTARSSWKRDEAAQLGSSVHAHAEALVNGQLDARLVSETEAAYVRNYLEWWTASGWTIRVAEAYIFSESGYGGTFDLLARDRDGKTVLADIKTGRAVYREVALQLAAYGMADYVARPTDTEAFKMPAIDRYAVIHVTADKVREVEIAVDSLDQQAFLACLNLYEWGEVTASRKF